MTENSTFYPEEQKSDLAFYRDEVYNDCVKLCRPGDLGEILRSGVCISGSRKCAKLCAKLCEERIGSRSRRGATQRL